LARRSSAVTSPPEPQVEPDLAEALPEPPATERTAARNDAANVRAASALARRVPGATTVPAKSGAAPIAPTTAEEKRTLLNGYWQGRNRGRNTDGDD
jgi:hypothetical protein